MYNDVNYNWTISKIATDVISGYQRGENPMDLFIKAAETHQLTPDLIDTACHYLNNEILLDRLEKKAEGNFKPISSSDVLKALGKVRVAEEKVASDKSVKDYWNLNEQKPVVKLAHDVEKTETLLNMEKSAQVKKDWLAAAGVAEAKKKANAEIMKLATAVKKEKESLYNDTYTRLNREQISPEDIYFLAKTASDVDVKEVYVRCLETYLNPLRGRPNQIDENDIVKIAQDIADNDIDESNPVIIKLKEFQNIKGILMDKVQEYETLYNKE